MPVTRVGAATRSNSASANTAYTGNLPQAPTNGNVLVMGFVGRRTGSDPVFTAPTGWTELHRQTTSAGVGDHGLTVICARTANGATAPSIAYTGSSSSVVIEEINGIEFSPATDDGHGSQGTGAGTSGAVTLTANLTTANANDWIFAVGGTTNLAASTFTWGGGQTADFAYGNVTNVGIGTSTQTLSSAGAKAPTLDYNRTSGTGMHVAVAFRQASIAHSVTPSDGATASDAAVKADGKNLTDGATASDAAVRASGKTLADTATTTDAASKTPGKALADSATATDSASRTPGKGLADTATASDSATRGVGHALTDTATGTDAVSKADGKALSDTATASDSPAISHGFGVAPTDSVTPTDAATRTTGKGLTDTATPTDSTARAVGHAITDSAAATDATGKATGKTLTDTTTPTDQISLTIGGEVTGDTVTPLDALSRGVGKHVADIAAATDLIDVQTTTVRTPTDVVTVTDQINVSRGLSLLLEDTIGCADDFPITTPSRNICGILYDHESDPPGTPIAGAIMRLFRTQDDKMVQQTTTNGAGFYQFLRDADDPYTYYVTAQVDGPVQVHGISDRGLIPEAV